jgi:radical SAM superfamily enzyme YgiQ (UPF0313 family)
MKHYLVRNYSIRGYWLATGWVLTSRGCPGRCTFCASSLTHGNAIRERHLNDVMDELKLLYWEYKIEGFWMLDDTFTVKTQRVLDFCAKFRESGLALKWGCQSRINTFNEAQAQALKESGCLQVDFGVESGSQKILNMLRKGITVEQSKKAFQICKKYKLRACATIMIGSPYETKDDIDKTKSLIRELNPDYVGIFYTTPYPGSELYKESVENKLIALSDDMFWEHLATPKFTTNFTADELHAIYDDLIKDNFKKTVFGYLLQPRFLFDMAKFLFMHSKFSFRLIRLAITGKKEKFINVVREIMVTGDF